MSMCSASLATCMFMGVLVVLSSVKNGRNLRYTNIDTSKNYDKVHYVVYDIV
jgi:hypothetical protein